MAELNILIRITKFIGALSFSGAVIVLIWLGFQYLTASGKVSEVNKSVLTVLAGLIIMTVAAMIPTLILSFLGQSVPLAPPR